jgi:hypothetical protein
LEFVHPQPSDEEIDFEHRSADPALAPDGELRRCLKRVLVQAKGKQGPSESEIVDASFLNWYRHICIY